MKLLQFLSYQESEVVSGRLLTIFLGIGFLAGKMIPGQASCFYMEIPPLRLPRLQAILTKTYVRLK
ncbi:MAG: hypothetical protein ACRC2S_15880 [Waterburya sp.]